MATEYQGWSEWADKYKPKHNHFTKDENALMFETYGEEVEYVKTIHPNFVWTYVDGEMSSLIVAGYHYVNRIGYYITENPWSDDMDSVLLSTEEECECYDEDAMDNGDRQEYGHPECEKCEGYGYVTNYL
jgi:hypothetical protein